MLETTEALNALNNAKTQLHQAIEFVEQYQTKMITTMSKIFKISQAYLSCSLCTKPTSLLRE